MKPISHCLLAALVLFTICPAILRAQSADGFAQHFQEANAAYSKKDYNKAIGIYEQLTHRYGYASGVLYNLANSYAKSGKVGKAIVNYERALRLDPGNSDILGNLQLIRHEQGLFLRPPSPYGKFLQILDINDWVALGALGLILLTATLLAAFRYSLTRRLLISLCGACLLVVSLATLNTVLLYRNWSNGVVTTDHTPLMISPFPGADTAGDIMAGRQVLPGQRHGNYLQVEEETGRSGWIPLAAFEPIIPPTP